MLKGRLRSIYRIIPASDIRHPTLDIGYLSSSSCFCKNIRPRGGKIHYFLENLDFVNIMAVRTMSLIDFGKYEALNKKYVFTTIDKQDLPA
jgi:hypothetical protein